MKVVVPWPVDDQRSQPLPDGVELVAWLDGDPPPEALDAEFVCVPFTAGDPGRLAAFTALRVVQTESAGVDWILGVVPEGVTLCDAGGMHDISVSEWVLAAVLASVRQLPDLVRAQEERRWAPTNTRELAGRRVLIVGYGSIGRAVERRLSCFEVDLTRVARTARAGVHSFDELPALLPQADVVVLLVPLTDQTRGLVDTAFLAALPDGALVVNASRGAILDQDALLDELGSGRITAVLDVTTPEPLPVDHPLWSAPGLLLTPHIGGDTTGLYPRMQKFLREQYARYVAGEPLLNVVHDGY
jgi:phosphoglycerate dehydrogenase-like enzyme